jgi:hypothetical protein
LWDVTVEGEGGADFLVERIECRWRFPAVVAVFRGCISVILRNVSGKLSMKVHLFLCILDEFQPSTA